LGVQILRIIPVEIVHHHALHVSAIDKAELLAVSMSAEVSRSALATRYGRERLWARSGL